jgi:hypothetical protein
MVNAYLCAETLAKMIVGEDPSRLFPRNYVITAERLRQAIDESAKGNTVKRIEL